MRGKVVHRGLPLYAPRTLSGVIRRHPLPSAFVAIALALAVAVPIAAYVVVPIFVRSTLVEAPPAPSVAPQSSSSAAASSTAAAVERTIARGALVRITAVDFGTGVVRVIGFDTAAARFLRFEDVEIAAAPDMYVYLSDRSDGKPGTYLDLGKLKATSGSFNYEIPDSVDLSTIHSVVVWCRKFNVTVTYAALAAP